MEKKGIYHVALSGGGVFAAEYTPDKLLELLYARYGEYVDIELGPGKSKQRPAGIGLNPKADPTADIFHDLNFGIPLPSESVDFIWSNQVLEHIKRENFISLMNDLFRVLKPGAKMEHFVPHYLAPAAFGDPTHMNWFSETSFRYFCIDERTGEPFVEGFSDYGIECRFVQKLHQPRKWVDIHVVLEKLDES